MPVIKYNLANGTNAFNIGTGALPSGGWTGFISNDVANSSVDLVVTGGPALPRNLTWSGQDSNNGNALTSVWDINNTKDWLSNATSVAYNDNGGLGGDNVTLNDNGATNVVTLAATVSPTTVTVSNNVLNYKINDNNAGYSINGSGSLLKAGSGTLVLDNAGGLGITGGVTISSGTLQVGNNDRMAAWVLLCRHRGQWQHWCSAAPTAVWLSPMSSPAQARWRKTVRAALLLAAANTFTGAVTVASGNILQTRQQLGVGRDQ